MNAVALNDERIVVTDAASFGRVAVMYGGSSHEREVSLDSGNAVLGAVQKDVNAVRGTYKEIENVPQAAPPAVPDVLPEQELAPATATDGEQRYGRHGDPSSLPHIRKNTWFHRTCFIAVVAIKMDKIQ